MFRRRSAHACGCVPARWVVTVHRAARQDDSGSRRERSSGPLVPVTPGRAVPASLFLTNPHKIDSRRISFCSRGSIGPNCPSAVPLAIRQEHNLKPARREVVPFVARVFRRGGFRTFAGNSRSGKDGTNYSFQRKPEMGKAAGGGTGRSWGMGKFKKIAVDPELSEPVRRTCHTQEEQQSKHRDANYSNHRVLGRHVRALLEARQYDEHLQPRDHSARRPRPRKWPKGYIRIGTLVPAAG